MVLLLTFLTDVILLPSAIGIFRWDDYDLAIQWPKAERRVISSRPRHDRCNHVARDKRECLSIWNPLFW